MIRYIHVYAIPTSYSYLTNISELSRYIFGLNLLGEAVSLLRNFELSPISIGKSKMSILGLEFLTIFTFNHFARIIPKNIL